MKDQRIPIAHSPKGWHDLRGVELPTVKKCLTKYPPCANPDSQEECKCYNEAMEFESTILSAPLFRKEDEKKIKFKLWNKELWTKEFAHADEILKFEVWQPTDFQVYEIEVEGVETYWEVWNNDMGEDGLWMECSERTVIKERSMSSIQYKFRKLSRLVEGNKMTLTWTPGSVSEDQRDPKVPIRQWCAMCGQIHKIDYWVPDEIWYEAIHPYFNNSRICLNCFMARADEKFLPWDKEIKLWPCSFFTQREIQKQGFKKDDYNIPEADGK